MMTSLSAFVNELFYNNIIISYNKIYNFILIKIYITLNDVIKFYSIKLHKFDLNYYETSLSTFFNELLLKLKKNLYYFEFN